MPIRDETTRGFAFPESFCWGVATSAYQVEGGAREGGRGPSIWDTFSRIAGKTHGGATGDVACDHYHRYREDVALIAALGFNAYRFSVSWPRVRPDGRGTWNDAGWDFYDRLLDAMAEKNIAAHVTLYHWDLPQALEDQGGWRNRETAHRFAEYAAQLARRLGSRVKTIATLNEPLCVATFGHETGEMAPGLRDRAAATQVSHHLLLAHGLAIQAMRAEGHRGDLGIVLNQYPAYPADPDSEADRALARQWDGLWNRWYLDPIFFGSYPSDVLAALGADAPKIAAPDLKTIGQPLDFLGVNYYSRIWGSAAVPPVPAPNALGTTDMGWEIYPTGLTEHLVRLARGYNPPPIYITENGAAAADLLIGDRVHDAPRIRYFESHLDALEAACRQGVDVRGYFAWSLLDNFEWAHGYSKRFGLVYVDFETQRRILKDSALWFRARLESMRAGSRARNLQG
jgi:beta-glucosidase